MSGQRAGIELEISHFFDDLAKNKYASVRTIGTKRGRCRGQVKWTRQLQKRFETCAYVVSFLEQS